jgi:PAS domain S-box-containing protein
MEDNMDGILADRKFASAILGESPIVIALMNTKGKFIYVNSMAQKFWEYTEDELLKKYWQDLTHPEDLRSDLDMHQQLLDGEFEVPYYSMCKRYITKSGRMVWGSVTVHLLKGTAEPIYFLSQVVPLDVMHHMNNNFFEKLTESRSRTKTSSEKVKAKDKDKEPIQILGFKIPELNKMFLVGIISILASVIVFMSDFKYNQKRIGDVEKKIEDMNAKFDASIDKLTKLIEANMKQTRVPQNNQP